MGRISKTKIGDVFSVKIAEGVKKYFQLIAMDSLQLNSDVIRVFKKTYSIDSTPIISEVINEEIDFYVHCVTKIGLKMDLWEKVGNVIEIGDISQILFRGTRDYGSKIGEKAIKVSNNWYTWHINDDDFKQVGRLEGENKDAYVGLVINPLGIIELLKGNKYPINYPSFE